MKKQYSLLVILILIGINTFGFTCLQVNGTIEDHRKGINEVIIKVLKNGHPDTIVATNSKGRFTIDLSQNCEYNLIVSKEGYMLQNILFDTHLSNPDQYRWDYRFAMNLLPNIDNDNSGAFLEPVAVIAYNDENDEFEKLYSSDEFMFNDKIEVYQNLMAVNYDQVIVLADSAFMQNDYILAKELYTSAAKLNEGNEYADIQLDIIRRIMAREQRQNNRFWKYVITADSLMVDNNLQKAKKLYERANKLQSSNYVTQQLNRIEVLESESNVFSVR